MFSTSVLQSGSNFAKVRQIKIGNKRITTPMYFPSVSSAETRTKTMGLMQVLLSNNYPRILISCYDIARLPESEISEMINDLNEFVKRGNFLFLDSGEFEREHFGAIWPVDKYKKIIQEVNSDFFASYDCIPVAEVRYDQILETTNRNLSQSFPLIKNNQCVAICHGQDPVEICALVQDLIVNHREFLKMIAVVERECGQSIEEQYYTISKIRKTLDDAKQETIIHVLGCGNPLSMALLAYAGADSFDAVDWSRWIIDNKTLQCGTLTHVSLLDCSCIACSSEVLHGKEKAWFHNLAFYQDYMTRLQNAIYRNDQLSIFLNNENVDVQMVSKISKLF